jgi:hypothetical protein
MYIREMFTSSTTDTTSKPFYIKDGTNYKYPLYTSADNGGNLVGVTINGVQYYRPSTGLKTKTRPPLGIPELIVTPSGNLAIGNSADLTTVNYDVWGVPSSFDFGSIYQGTTKKATFLLENGEFSGSFTESGASSGDAYSLYVERTDVSSSDNVTINVPSSTTPNTFGYTGAIQSYTVPSDVTNIRIKCWGAAGGNSSNYQNGGVGGYAQGDVEVTPGETLYVAVGQGGIGGTTTIPSASGSGAGMTGVLSVWNTSDVDATHDGSIVIAGGGGGGGDNAQYGGNGGGDSGGNSSQTHHRPGTQTAGGDYSSIGSHGGSAGGDGVKFRGGKGGGGSQSENDSVWPNRVWGDGFYGSPGGGDGQNGAGGGGGYWGAAGFHDLNGNSGSAGGGSGYIGGGSTHTVSNGQNLLTSAHDSSSLPPNTSDSDYNGSAGKRASSNGANGGSGYVVITPLAGGKTIPKVTGATFDSTNVTFTVQQDSSSSIANIKYTINGGSEQTTPVGTLAVAHNLSGSASITVVAYAVDANGVQISTKKTVTGTIPLLFTNFPSTIAFTGWWNDNFSRWYQLTSNTDTFIQYELYDSTGLVGAEYGSTFTLNSSGILFNVEDTGDTSTPFSYSNGGTLVGTSGIVEVGDSITLWASSDGSGTAEAVFTVPNFLS